MSDDAFEVDDEYLLIGRTYEEYEAMFALDEPDGPVLDCASGVGSFVVEAREQGLTAVGADVAYSRPYDVLARAARRAQAETIAQLQAKRHLYEWEFYGDVETRETYLERASERFLADYPDGRYVAAGLPDLPFADGAFRLALSANFLFLYDDRLDRTFHEAALAELTRIADEVRVFPLASLDRTRSAYVTPSIETLRDAGRTVRVADVPYEFQPGATEMLLVR